MLINNKNYFIKFTHFFSLKVKFTVDGLIETLRRTKLRFVHCFLPQHSAGMCESRTALLSVRSIGGQADDSLINLPLIRSQVNI